MEIQLCKNLVNTSNKLCLHLSVIQHYLKFNPIKWDNIG